MASLSTLKTVPLPCFGEMSDVTSTRSTASSEADLSPTLYQLSAAKTLTTGPFPAVVSFKGHSVVNLGKKGTVKGMTAACSTRLMLVEGGHGMGEGSGTFTLCFEQSLASGGVVTGSKKLVSGVYRVDEWGEGSHDDTHTVVRIALHCTEMSGMLMTAHTTAFEPADAFKSKASFSLHVASNNQAALSIDNIKDQLMFMPYPKVCHREHPSIVPL